MADIITTEYEDDPNNDFIQCRFCNKSIRGDTQYRIHLTTLQHLKREEAASGRAPSMPVWEGFMKYLDYLNLDEPIIGLNSIEQVEEQVQANGTLRVKYKCKQCNLETDPPGMASHVVGRKHRQKFVEMRRPDLVTWDDTNNSKQGTVIRAKAEIVERQEGRGKSKELPKQRTTRWNDPQQPNVPVDPREELGMGHTQAGSSRERGRFDPPQGFPKKHNDDDYHTTHAYPLSGEYHDEDYRVRYHPEDSNRHPREFSMSVKRDLSVTVAVDRSHERHHVTEAYHVNEGGYRRPQAPPDDLPRQRHRESDIYDPFENDSPPRRPPPLDDHPSLPHPEGERRQHVYEYNNRSRPRAGQHQEVEPSHLPIEWPHSEREARGPSYPREDRRPPGPAEGYADAYPNEDPYGGYVEDVRDRDRRSFSREGSSDRRPRRDIDHRYVGREGREQFSEERFQPPIEDDRAQRAYSDFEPEGHEVVVYGRSAPERGMQRDWPRAGELPPRPEEGRRRPYPDYPQHQDTFQEPYPAKRKKSRFTDCTEDEIDLLLKCQRAKAVSEKIVQDVSSHTRRRPGGGPSRGDFRQREKVEQDYDHRRSEGGSLREDFRERGRPEQDPGHFMDLPRHPEEADFREDFRERGRVEDPERFVDLPRPSESGHFREDYRDHRMEQDPPSVQDVYRHDPERERLKEDYRQQGRVEPDSGNVLNVLKGVQIESVEEANFLKTKLCSLLKEFQAGKSDKRGDQISPMESDEYGHPRGGVSERAATTDYGHRTREMPQADMRRDDFHHQVTPERYKRDDFHHQVTAERYERDEPLQRREHSMPDERIEEYPRGDFHREHRRSPPRDVPGRYNDGFPQPYEYPPPPEDHYRDMRPVRARYEEEINPPTSLDKIASTLLQLVAHK